MELADTSVWVWKSKPAIDAWFSASLRAGEIAVCDMVALELLHAAHNGVEFRRLEEALLALHWVPIVADDWTRAREVYRSLADERGGFQRSVQHPDLLIAACAERAGLPLVHYDADYDAITSVTGQQVRWGAPRGSL